MISNEKYNEVLNSGLSLDHYFVLECLAKKVELVKNKRIQGFINLLNKKGYLEDEKLTKKALDLVGRFRIIVNAGSTKDFAEKLHKSCQEKLISLTGKKQVIDKINNKPYSFLPNIVDLERSIIRFMKEYKFYDTEKIEKCVLNYIEKCNSARSWFPVLQYYIIKNSSSPLMTDIESGDEESTSSFKSSQKLL